MKAHRIHRTILTNTVQPIKALIANKVDDISECEIREALRNGFDINGYQALIEDIEREGRTDLVIYNTAHEPIILYEIKTYFKPNERFDILTAKNAIEYDLYKLATRRNDAVGYFLFICSKTLFERCKDRCELSFITDLAEQNKQYDVKTFLGDIRLITKRREESDDFYLLSFEIEKN